MVSKESTSPLLVGRAAYVPTVTQNGDHFIQGPQRHEHPPDLKLPLQKDLSAKVSIA